MAKIKTQYGQPANYNASPATRLDGQGGALEVDNQGRLKTTTAPLSSATDSVSTITVPIATSTGSNVNSSATNVTLLAANANRRAATVYNDSTQVLYLKYGATASATSFKVAISPNGYFEFPLPIYTGTVDGIWAAANGAARITEEV